MNDTAQLRQTIYEYIQELIADEGVFYASGKQEVYGCLFGRDSAITILKLLKVHEVAPDDALLQISKNTLLRLVALQGQEVNIESGEEPGKFIHEYRPRDYERLLTLEKPWFIYPEGVLKNYDSLDSTPLALLALYRYWKVTGDNEFLLSVLPAVERGLNWIITYGDRDKDLLVEYELPKERKHGGLPVQSWTDSHNVLRDKNGKMPLYPIAPVDVQGVTWLALKVWGEFYNNEYSEYHNTSFGQKLLSQARGMKENFNKAFLIKDNGHYYAAQALDGHKNQIKTIMADPLICLWAAYKDGDKVESIIDDKYIPDFITRAFMSDMFVESAGIRTMSAKSETFNPNEDSYHNGSFWTHLNGLIHEGLCNFGYMDEAEKLLQAALKPVAHFNSPIELYIERDGTYLPFKNEEGQVSCFNQAWAAASALDWLTR